MGAERLEGRMSAASDPKRSAWVAANAGAGKTHTLAARVTRLLLSGARPERILCLTYTKAAAAEMAQRLFEQLGRWSMLPDAELAQRIAELGGDIPDTEGLRRARRLFAEALETPGGLKIQTIHAFCQYVLTRFPLEAGVPASFRVLDERTARELAAEARVRVLERAGAGDALRATAIAYLVAHLSDVRLEQILDAALGADRGKLEAFLAFADRTRRLKLAHGAQPDDDEQRIAGEFNAALDRKRLRESADWLSGGSKKDQERGAALAAAAEQSDSFLRLSLIGAALLTKEGAPRASLATKPLQQARPDLFAFLDMLAARAAEAEDRLRAVHGANLTDAALTLAETARDIYASEKRARGVLDYDDLIAETHRLLRDRGAAWVLYKLDEGIDHVLIDEAQDTSSLQWDIVQSLTEEFFAGEGAVGGVRTLFAVGDEKQSIFSFQGADPAQFEARRRFFAARAGEAKMPFSSEYLQTSRRSAPQILRFVDEVFSDPAAREGLTSVDQAIKHEPFRTEARGRVEFWPALKPAKSEDADLWDLRPVDLAREGSPVALLAKQITEKIAGWLAKRERLPGHATPIQPGDIMILLPRREPFGSEIIRRLKARGVPVAGADRIKLTEQIAVMDLIALGRFALLPEDDLNLAALLRSPLVGLGEDDLFALAHGRHGTLWQALERSDFAEARAFLETARARADYAPPFEFYAQTLDAEGGRLKLLKRLGSETEDAIDEFLSLALAYESAEPPSLEGFLHWLERGGAEIKRDMERGRGEVRVMTVHGAKGLEADIVILPDTTTLPENPATKGHILYTDEGALFPLPDKLAPRRLLAAKAAAQAETLKEHRRLFYVALTRAKERLIICGFENKTGLKPGSWHALAERAAKALGLEVDGIHVYGEPAPTFAEASAPQATQCTPVPDWALKPAPAERPRPWIIRPSEAAAADEPAFPPRAAQVQKGLLVHALLARLPEIAPARRAEAARKFLLARGVRGAEAESWTAQTLAVLDDPVFAPAFAVNSREEVSLMADLPELGPQARVHGRIDRLAVGPEEVLIVDFKTGPVRETDLPALYATQMALYRAAALRIFPGRRIACALLWVEGPLLQLLPDALLDREIARVRSRLDRAGQGS
jgi:ATP-dependent helicase/nuclease subunit A